MAQAADPAPVTFRKHVLNDQYFCDGVGVGDFNRDGQIDIVAGPYWYEGPHFTSKHEIYPPKAFDPAASPTDSLFSFVHDFNGDGWDDALVLGRVHLHAAFWYENPRDAAGHWKKHYVFERVQGENPPFGDLTGDGRPEIICHHAGCWGYLAPDWERVTEPWTFHPLTAAGEYDQFYHGEGIGDINGDGRPDLLLNDGWWENPGLDGRRPWTARPFRFSSTRGGAQMFIQDVNGDGAPDVITALDAHGWGLAWFEQVRDATGRITFVEHKIMGDRTEIDRYGAAFSQPHALALADIDGDGLEDIIVGKRRWAHGPTGDIEPNADPVVYWFRLTRDAEGVRYTPHRIDNASGVGLQIQARDLNGDGKTDVVTCSKLGVFLFLQE